jgi:hypothetical protein
MYCNVLQFTQVNQPLLPILISPLCSLDFRVLPQRLSDKFGDGQRPIVEKMSYCALQRSLRFVSLSPSRGALLL